MTKKKTKLNDYLAGWKAIPPKHTRKKQHKKPEHNHHGRPYTKPEFGIHDEKEAVKDYMTLNRHLKTSRSKRILKHIIKEERDHVHEFGKIKKYES